MKDFLSALGASALIFLTAYALHQPGPVTAQSLGGGISHPDTHFDNRTMTADGNMGGNDIMSTGTAFSIYDVTQVVRRVGANGNGPLAFINNTTGGVVTVQATDGMVQLYAGASSIGVEFQGNLIPSTGNTYNVGAFQRSVNNFFIEEDPASIQFVTNNVVSGWFGARHIAGTPYANPEWTTGHMPGWRNTRSVTGAYTVVIEDYQLFVDATAGSATQALPPLAVSQGRVINIGKSDASGNTVVADGDGAETINGALTFSVGSQYDNITVIALPTTWLVQ